MGRKWTNIKFDLDRPEKPIAEASSQPRTRREALYDFLREEWNDENVAPHPSVDVMYGNLSEDKLKQYMDIVFEQFDFVNRAGAVFVTDSAHIGYSWLFERDGSKAKISQRYTGYEGAKGVAASKMLYDNHQIKVNHNWLWD